MALDECSAKARTGPSVNDEDYELPVWAGVVPLETVARAPVADPRLGDGIESSRAVAGWVATAGGS